MAYSKWAINQSIRKADRIITVSNYEKKQIVKLLNLEPDRISTTYLAPNPIFKPATNSEKSTWRSNLSENFGIHNKFIFGIGYEPRKNIELLIEIFSKLSSEQRDLDLVIVCAEDNRKSFFRELTNKFKITGRTHLLGSIPPEILVILYNLAEAFIYPSERESFGLPPLEAISCGTPTIAMNKTSLPEVLKNAAIFVDGKDVQSWTNLIKRVLTNTSLRLKLNDEGLKQASTFNWQKCALETIQVYEEILEGLSKKD